MNRTISDLVKELLKNNDVSIKDVSEALGYTQQSFRNKLTRDSFSIKELMIISSLCGLNLGIINEDNDEIKPIILHLKDYLTEEELDKYAKVKLAQIQENVNKLNELISALPENERNDILTTIVNNYNNKKNNDKNE